MVHRSVQLALMKNFVLTVNSLTSRMERRNSEGKAHGLVVAAWLWEIGRSQLGLKGKLRSDSILMSVACRLTSENLGDFGSFTGMISGDLVTTYKIGALV